MRYQTCLRFAQRSALKTRKHTVVLALPNGRFRAMFMAQAFAYGLDEFIAVMVNPNNGERKGQ